MLKEITVCGKTVEAALEEASNKTGLPVEQLQFEILEQPKKGFLGIGNVDAKLLIKYDESPCERAESFLRTFMDDLGFTDVAITSHALGDEEIVFGLSGENLGLVIGRHGEILDSLQYLANLAANRQEKDFVRITVDIENYRERRIEVLRSLAHKTANRVIKSGRIVSLEPMSPYERRIIHSEAQNISGVMTFSVGAGDERRIIMAPENYKKQKEIESGDISIADEERSPAPQSSGRRSGGKGRPGRSSSSLRSSAPKSRTNTPAMTITAGVSPEGRAEAAEKAEKKEKKYDPDFYKKNATEVAGSAPKVYEYNPVRQPQQIKKVKSIEELGLADVEDTEEVLLKK